MEPPLKVDLSDRSPAARRRRNLVRGIDRWCVGTSADGLPPGRVLLMTLTFRSEEPDDGRGAIRTFWHHYRDTFGRRPYFSWVELQFRGALHYHAILVNPPWKTRGAAVRWIERHWPHASITPSLEWRPKSWFVSRAGAYVKKYARKVPPPSIRVQSDGLDKSYQQRYEELPRAIRTYEHSALSWYVKDVDAHRSRGELVNVSSAPIGTAEWLASWWLIASVHHDPAPGACTLRKTKRRGPIHTRPRRFTRRRRVVRTPHQARA